MISVWTTEDVEALVVEAIEDDEHAEGITGLDLARLIVRMLTERGLLATAPTDTTKENR